MPPLARCPWPGDDPLMVAYHDTEWGVPLREEGKLFEFLLLDGAQAGLSWRTILHKREGYRQAFDHFDAARIAQYDAVKVAQLLANPALVRNRQKIAAAISNAQALPALQQEWGSFAAYLWSFVNDRPIKNRWEKAADIPAVSPESTAMSRDLRRRGFRFVGPTICYAFIQSAGLVNDHLLSCFRHEEVDAGNP